MKTGHHEDAMRALTAHGYTVREDWLGSYYDGIIATVRVGAHTVEIYCGGAEDGEQGPLHYGPVVYVDDRAIARDCTSVEHARRIADIRARMLRAAHAKGMCHA